MEDILEFITVVKGNYKYAEQYFTQQKHYKDLLYTPSYNGFAVYLFGNLFFAHNSNYRIEQLIENG